MKRTLLTKIMFLLCALIAGSSSVWATDVTYTITSASAVSTSGTAPDGSSATFSNTYTSNKFQMTSGKIQTLTLSGYNGYNITKITLSMHSNKSGGGGKLSYSTDGGTTFSYIIGSADAGLAFNNAAWNSAYSQDFVDVVKSVNIACSSSDVVIKIEATANSLFCQSYTLTYESASDPRAATTVNLNEGYSTEVYMGETVVSPSLKSVSTPSADIDGATVTWSSTNEAVATIAADGKITLVAPGTTKIKANYAGTVGEYKPSEASYDLSVYGSYNSIEALQAAATSTSTKMKVTFTDAVVTAVKDVKNAYIVEGEKGILIYNSTEHGLTAGKTISGTLKGANVVLYKGATEITGFTTDGLTVSDGSVPSPVVKTIDNLSAANVGLIVTLNEVTYNETTTQFSDGTNEIAYYDTFTASPTLVDGKTYNVTGMVNYYNNLQISPLNASGVSEVTSKTTPTSVWKSGGSVVETLTYTKGDAFSATFETDSDGDQSFESSNTEVATVDDAGNISFTGTVGIVTITATTASNSSYFVSNASLTITVREPIEDGIFNFGNYQDYGSGVVPTSENVYVEEEKTWTAGDITMTTNGKIRWYIGSGGLDLKLYTKVVSEAETTKFTISAPSGKKLTKIVITGNGHGKLVAEGYSAGTWTGLADNVTFTYGGTGTIGISTITVYYSEPTISITMGEAGWMTYFNVGAALSFGDMKAYTISAVGANSVTLKEITEAPANTAVILQATPGNHTLTVLESAESVSGNKLSRSDGTAENNESRDIYALASKGEPAVVGFYKMADGIKVPAGKCYVSVSKTSSPEFLGFDFDNLTNIANINAVFSNEGAVYDLQGRKVAKPAKGLYIVNGRKVIIK